MERALVVALALALAAPARADTDYFAKPNDSSAIVVRHAKSRTQRAKLAIGGLALGAVLSGGLAVHFHLVSRSAADDVAANHDRIVGTWTLDRQATYDRGQTAGIEAIVGYSVAGAFLAGALVTMFLTEPGYEEQKLRPTVSSVDGGAVVGGSVRF